MFLLGDSDGEDEASVFRYHGRREVCEYSFSLHSLSYVALINFLHVRLRLRVWPQRSLPRGGGEMQHTKEAIR